SGRARPRRGRADAAGRGRPHAGRAHRRRAGGHSRRSGRPRSARRRRRPVLPAMILLRAAFDPQAIRRPAEWRVAWLVAAAPAVALVAIGAAVELHGRAGRDLGRAVASAGGHGGMLVAGWLVATG